MKIYNKLIPKVSIKRDRTLTQTLQIRKGSELRLCSIDKLKSMGIMRLGASVIGVYENNYGPEEGSMCLNQSSYQYMVNGVFIDRSCDTRLLYQKPSEYVN